MKPVVLLVVALLEFTVYGVSLAQRATEFYRKSRLTVPTVGLGFRAGINYSVPTIVASEVGTPSPVPYIRGIVPQFGYYAGGYIYKSFVTSPLTLRLDAGLQMKSFGAEYMGQLISKHTFYSLGLSPLIGFNLTRKLTVLTGPETNLQLARGNPYILSKGYPLEIGTVLRLIYAFGHFRAELSYFRAFTPIDQTSVSRLPGSSAVNYFYNQNGQFGLVFQLD